MKFDDSETYPGIFTVGAINITKSQQNDSQLRKSGQTMRAPMSGLVFV